MSKDSDRGALRCVEITGSVISFCFPLHWMLDKVPLLIPATTFKPVEYLRITALTNFKLTLVREYHVITATYWIIISCTSPK